MDPTIITALIGGVFTIVASIVTFMITRIFDSDIWATRNVRQIRLNGHWEANFHQEVGPDGAPLSFPGIFIFKSGRQSIRGEAHIELLLQNKKISVEGTFTARFVHGRYLKLEYQIKNQPEVIQFGYMLLELSTSGYELNGHFLGIGALSQRIIWGTVQIRKPGAFYSNVANP